MDNDKTDSIRGRVSNAFAQHLGQLRDNLLSRQQSGQEPSTNHNRLLSFQDVRNHFDQLEPLDNETNNQMVSNSSKRVNDNKKVDNNQQQNFENDWEDIYHRARR